MSPGAVLLVLVMAVSAVGEARQGTDVDLEFHDCIVDTEVARRLLENELGKAAPPSGDGPAATHVVVTCDVALVEVRVINSVTGKVLGRRFTLDQTEGIAQPRLLALAVAELVSSSWRVAPRSADVPAEPRTRVVPEAVIAGSRGKGWRASAFAAARFVEGLAEVSYGAGLDLGLRRAGGDVVVERSIVAVSLGEVEVTMLSTAPSARLGMAHGRTSLEGMLGVRLGLVILRGTPADPSTEAATELGMWAGPVAGARVARGLGGRWVAVLGTEAGWTVRGAGALVGGRREAAVDGYWVSLSLGLGLGR